MKNLIIIGARGFGREVYNTAVESIGYGSDYNVKGFLDDKEDALNNFSGYPPILSSVEDYQIGQDDVFICALGDVKWKKHYCSLILKKGGKFISLIHKTAYISMNVKIGMGCIICAGARIHCDVTIGDFVVLQPYAILGHDVKVGNWSIINAFADCGGMSQIGENCTINTTSFVVPKGVVGDNATVGAGSVTLRKVKPGTTVFGVPAKPIFIPQLKSSE